MAEFSAIDYFKSVYEKNYRKHGCKAETLSEYVNWKKDFKKRLTCALGIDKMTKVNANFNVLECVDMGGYTREKCIINTQEKLILSFYILKPKVHSKKLPVMITPHGHISGGKYAVCGVRETKGISDSIETHNYDYGVQFVNEGFIVFAPDAIGFGERLEWYNRYDAQLLDSSCAHLNNMALSLGMSVAGIQAFDLMCLIDYICTREDCDTASIGCAGLSGGGLQTLYISALDERIKASVISGYFYGDMEALLEMPNCSCNYVHGLWTLGDMGDVACLIAPRPLFIETGDIDPLNGQSGLDNVVSQINIAKNAYKILNKENNLHHEICKGVHKWYGGASIKFMKDNLIKNK